jgi:chlorite dismutase
MADFIPPKNEVPEREISERAVTQVSGEWYVSQLSGQPDPPKRPSGEREAMQRISGVRPATMQGAYASPAAAAVATAPAIEPPRPVSPYAVQESGNKPAVKRQIVCFTFYKVMPEWRRLLPAEKALQKAEFADVLNRWNKPGEFLSLTYSTVGTRGDVDFCVWSIGYAVDELNRMRAELLRTPLGGYLTTPHSFLAMTKRSQYQIDRPDESESEGRGAIRPGGQKYIFIYPFWKTRQWYLLSAAERKRLMDEHIRIGLLYPRVKLNTTYSFGIDDQEFVVAFETNFPEDFLDLVQQLRETEISLYTLKDYPIFSCVRLQPLEMLDRIG